MSDPASEQQLAQEIAAGGRAALIERLRSAYLDAAAAHSDVVTVDPDRIDSMVQRAAERADGLQWRRALATVAAEKLGIEVTEALNHPAVAQAQQLVGAPSYEQSVSELVTRPVPPPLAAAVPAPTPTAEPEPEPEAALEPKADPEPEPEPTPLPEQILGQEELFPAAGGAEQTTATPVEETHSDSLEAISADDAVFDLLPPVDPGEFTSEDEQWVPEVVETTPPPTDELRPYVPEEEEAAAQFSEETVERADAPTETYEAFSDPHATKVHDMQAEFAAQDRLDSLPGHAEPEPAAPAPAADPAPVPAPKPDSEPLSAPAPADFPRRPDFPAVESDHAPDFSFADEFDDDDFDQGGASELRVSAYHLGGVSNLSVRDELLDLRISHSGLDILEPTEEIIGRLQWSDIDLLEAAPAKGRLLGKNRPGSKLIVRTHHGDATFEIPELSTEELRNRVQELLARYRG